MLVLTRKLQQQIKIGDQITVTVLRVKGNTVRVGIQAPRDVRVVRGELPKQGDAAGEPVAECAGETPTPEAEWQTAIAAPGGEAAEAGEEVVEGAVVAFRVKVEVGERRTGLSAPLAAGETPAPQVSAAHLPLRRIHDRLGTAPLKRVIASCNSLAK